MNYEELKIIVCSFDIVKIEKVLKKYTTKEINEELRKIETSPYKHATLDKAKLLIKYKIDVNLKLANGLRPVCFIDNYEVFLEMVNNGMSFENGILNGENVFTSQSNPHILQYLHDKTGVKPKFKKNDKYMTNFEYMPLEYDLLEMYLRNGFIDVNFEFKEGKTLIFYVNDLNSLILMEKYGFNLAHKDKNGNTCLREIKDVEAFKFLLSKGLSFKSETDFFDNYINEEIMKYLIKEYNIDIKEEKLSTYSPEIIDFCIKYVWGENKNKHFSDELYNSIAIKINEREKFMNIFQEKIIEKINLFPIEFHEFLLNYKDLKDSINYYLPEKENKMFSKIFEKELNHLTTFFFYNLELSYTQYVFNYLERIYNICLQNRLFSEEKSNINFSNFDFERISNYEEISLPDCQYNNKKETINILKIKEYINNNKEIKEKLFYLYDESLVFWGYFDPREQDIVEKTNWIFDGYNPVGLFVRDGNQKYIGYNEDGEFYNICNYVQDYPLALFYSDGLRLIEREEEVENDELFELLNKYLVWCEKNDILIDQDKIFLDENGKIKNKNLLIS